MTEPWAGAFGASVAQFERELECHVQMLAADSAMPRLLAEKQQGREADERARPLAAYRAQELARVAENFFGADVSYHQAWHAFVHKVRTPPVPAGLAA